LRGQQSQLDVARRNVQNQRTTLDLTTARLDAGRGTELDTSRAQAQLSSTLATIGPLEAAVARSIHRLSVLTGREPTALTTPLSTPRNYHTATLLPNGKVLVAGGQQDTSTPLTIAELFDPGSGTWTNTGSLGIRRWSHKATLLPNGKVLISGGLNSDFPAIGSVELYDPATQAWSPTGSLNIVRLLHTMTLLPDGKVLVAGGQDNNFNLLDSAEIYDVGLGFSPSSQPQIISDTSPLSLSSTLTLTGSRFRGISEASCGNSQDSATDYPVVQLRSLQTDQILFIGATSWSGNSFTSAPVNGLPPGHVLATVFANGIPSAAAILRLDIPQIFLTNPIKLPGGAFQFSFTNNPGSTFTVWATINISLAVTNWTALGPATEISPGQFQFTDAQAAGLPQRFYQVSSP